MTDRGDARILYLIGAQKAGTTWFADWCRSHPQVAVPPFKELHYWEAVEKGFTGASLKRLDKLIGRLSRQKRKGEDPDGTLDDRMAVVKAYREEIRAPTAKAGPYLDFLWSRHRGEPYVLDATPAYAILNETTFERMAGAAPETRFLFLLRDPVDRLWSSTRMKARTSPRRPDEVELMARRLDGFERSGLDGRSDYAGTLERLETVVPREHLHVDFYERLFEQPTLDRIVGHLGIDAHPGDFARRSNEGHDVGLSDDLRARAAAILAPVYDACAERFGDALPDKWSRHRAMAHPVPGDAT